MGTALRPLTELLCAFPKPVFVAATWLQKQSCCHLLVLLSLLVLRALPSLLEKHPSDLEHPVEAPLPHTPPKPAPHLHTISQDKLVDNEGDEVAAGHLPGDDEVAPVVQDTDLDHQQRELGIERRGHLGHRSLGSDSSPPRGR